MKLLNFLFPTDTLDLTTFLEGKVIDKEKFKNRISAKGKFPMVFYTAIFALVMWGIAVTPLFIKKTDLLFILLYSMPYVLLQILQCICAKYFSKDSIIHLSFILFPLQLTCIILSIVIAENPSTMEDFNLIKKLWLVILFLSIILVICNRINYKKSFKQYVYRRMPFFIKALCINTEAVSEKNIKKQRPIAFFVAYFVGSSIATFFSKNAVSAILLVTAAFFTYPISWSICVAQYFEQALQIMSQNADFSD